MSDVSSASLPPPAPDAGIASASTLASAAAVRATLASLAAHSASLDAHLAQLLGAAAPRVAAARARIAHTQPQVALILEEAGVLQSRLADTSANAARISEAVRRLDEEQSRIDVAARWAERTADLRAALHSLASAIEQADWDAATRHCIRAMSIDADILGSDFAAAVVPSAELPLAPPQTLLSLRESLLEVFSRRFRLATEAKDSAEATRYFKMFPLVGWRNEGLSVYSEFARAMVRERGRVIVDALVGGSSTSTHHHASLLTSLFEHLALLIDQHQPLVDRNYGPGGFALGVMPGLQEECDRLGRRVWDAWWDERLVPRKLDSARSHSFAYVASLGASSLRGLSRGAPGRPGTPLNGGGTGTATPVEQEGPDGKDVDRLLTELAGMAARWGTYQQFLQGRLGAENGTAAAEEEAEDSTQPSGVPASALGKQLADGLQNAYVPLETWYLRISIEKAHRLDTPDLSARPLTSSVLDDVFYVLRSILARSISTASVETVAAMTKAARWVMDEEFVQAIVRRMETVWRGVSSSMTVDGPRKEAATREMRTTFIVYLNVLSVSADYTERILAELSSEQVLGASFAERDLAEVASMVQGLGVLVTRIKSAVRTEMDQLFTQLTRARLRPILTEAYRDVSYLLDDDAFSEAEFQDPVRRRFIKGWETVLAGYEELFVEANWEAYFSLTLDALVRSWEKLAMGMRYTELGALRFDKDVRTICSWLANHSKSGSVRDKFARLQQVSYVLNLDDDDLPAEGAEAGAEAPRDLYSEAEAAGMAWRLSPDEVAALLRDNRVRA